MKCTYGDQFESAVRTVKYNTRTGIETPHPSRDSRPYP